MLALPRVGHLRADIAQLSQTGTDQPRRTPRPHHRRTQGASQAAQRGQSLEGGAQDPEEGGGLFRKGRWEPVSAFKLIEVKKATHSVPRPCRMLRVSRSGYHAWRSRPPAERAIVPSTGRVGLGPTTTPWRRASSPPSRRSCSAAAPGPPDRLPRTRSSSTSKASTTPAGGTRRQPTSAPPSSRGLDRWKKAVA